ncbi:acyltransferase family protein [Sphingomonas sp. 7/4-4]|uniref:acyltransferase family protein n=1 Tax=Sphingomonas sp. 7/4-4 TaxID=3018446 RepID=UPI00300E3AEE
MERPRLVDLVRTRRLSAVPAARPRDRLAPRAHPRDPRRDHCAARAAAHRLHAAGAAALGQEIPRLGLLRCVLEFACGTAIGALWLRWRETWRLPAIACTAAALVLLAGWIAGPFPETLAVPAAFAALLLALALTAGKPGNPLEGRALHYLGEISYATYLGHFLLWFAFKLAFIDDAHAVGAPLIAAYLVLVLASSAALYHWVERPAQRRVNGLGFRRPRRAQPAGSGSPHG